MFHPSIKGYPRPLLLSSEAERRAGRWQLIRCAALLSGAVVLFWWVCA